MPENKDRLIVDTPMGTLVAYPSTDPHNPGICIDLRRDGCDASLNLVAVECNIGEDGFRPNALALHAWEIATQEDTTTDTTFRNVEHFFNRQTRSEEH